MRLAEAALYALLFIRPDPDGARFVSKGLEGAEGTEKGALGAPLRQEGQDHDKAQEQSDEYDHLNERRERNHLHVFRHRFEGAQPVAVRRRQAGGGRQHNDQKDRKGEIPPGTGRELDQGPLDDARKAVFQAAEEAAPPAKAAPQRKRGADPDDEHAGGGVETANIDAGNMSVLPRAAGIRAMGITMWQKGASARRIFASVRAMLPRTSTT